MPNLAALTIIVFEISALRTDRQTDTRRTPDGMTDSADYIRSLRGSEETNKFTCMESDVSQLKLNRPGTIVFNTQNI